jgi:hypothetical protein
MDVHVTTNIGATALHAACCGGHADIARYLQIQLDTKRPRKVKRNNAQRVV